MSRPCVVLRCDLAMVRRCGSSSRGGLRLTSRHDCPPAQPLWLSVSWLHPCSHVLLHHSSRAVIVLAWWAAHESRRDSSQPWFARVLSSCRCSQCVVARCGVVAPAHETWRGLYWCRVPATANLLCLEITAAYHAPSKNGSEEVTVEPVTRARTCTPRRQGHRHRRHDGRG